MAWSTRDRPSYSFYQAGGFDLMKKWGNSIPIGWESYDYLLTGLTGTTWGIYNGLDKHADYMVCARRYHHRCQPQAAALISLMRIWDAVCWTRRAC